MGRSTKVLLGFALCSGAVWAQPPAPDEAVILKATPKLANGVTPRLALVPAAAPAPGKSEAGAYFEPKDSSGAAVTKYDPKGEVTHQAYYWVRKVILVGDRPVRQIFGDKDLLGKIRASIDRVWSGEIDENIVLVDGVLQYRDTVIDLDFGVSTGGKAPVQFADNDQNVMRSQFLAYVQKGQLKARLEQFRTLGSKSLAVGLESPFAPFPDEAAERQALRQLADILEGKDVKALSLDGSHRLVLNKLRLEPVFYEVKDKKTVLLSPYENAVLAARLQRHNQVVISLPRAKEEARVARLAVVTGEIDTLQKSIEAKVATTAEKAVRDKRRDELLVLGQRLKAARQGVEKEAKAEERETLVARIEGLETSLEAEKEVLLYPIPVVLPKECTGFALRQDARSRFTLSLSLEGGTAPLANFSAVREGVQCDGESLVLIAKRLTIPKGPEKKDPKPDDVPAEPALLEAKLTDAVSPLGPDGWTNVADEMIFLFRKQVLVVAAPVTATPKPKVLRLVEIAPKTKGLQVAFEDFDGYVLEYTLDGKQKRARLKAPEGWPNDVTGFRFFLEPDNVVRIAFADDQTEHVLGSVPGFDFKRSGYLKGSLAFVTDSFRPGPGLEKAAALPKVPLVDEKGKEPKGPRAQAREPGKMEVVVLEGRTLHRPFAERPGWKLASVSAAEDTFRVAVEKNADLRIDIAPNGTEPVLRWLLPAGCEKFRAVVEGTERILSLAGEKGKRLLHLGATNGVACAKEHLLVLAQAVRVVDAEGGVGAARAHETLVVVDGEGKVTAHRRPEGLRYEGLAATTDGFTLRVRGPREYDVAAKVDANGVWSSPRWIYGKKAGFVLLHAAEKTVVLAADKVLAVAEELGAAHGVGNRLALVAHDLGAEGDLTEKPAAFDLEPADAKKPAVAGAKRFYLLERTKDGEANVALVADPVRSDEPFVAVSLVVDNARSRGARVAFDKNTQYQLLLDPDTKAALPEKYNEKLLPAVVIE